jgi:pyridoxal phosphate enzyme (YggS family)
MGDDPTAEMLRARLTSVERRIAEAAARVGRDPGGVRLVVITKGHPIGTLRTLYEIGQRHVGENRIEEALPKVAALAELPGIEWHLVGPLQSRKVRWVERQFALLHAVDRVKAARLLDERAASLGRRQPILLEWNVSGEPTKAGWHWEADAGLEASLPEVREVAGLEHLDVRGLMTMAPETREVEIQHAVFRRLATLRTRLAEALERDLPELSMGMSDDFEAAVEEGATIVRIGRAILGERM